MQDHHTDIKGPFDNIILVMLKFFRNTVKKYCKNTYCII